MVATRTSRLSMARTPRHSMARSPMARSPMARSHVVQSVMTTDSLRIPGVQRRHAQKGEQPAARKRNAHRHAFVSEQARDRLPSAKRNHLSKKLESAIVMKPTSLDLQRAEIVEYSGSCNIARTQGRGGNCAPPCCGYYDLRRGGNAPPNLVFRVHQTTSLATSCAGGLASGGSC